MPNPTCAKRLFCACHDCRAFTYDATGTRRGTPLTIRAERHRALAAYTPTHRKEA